MTLTASIRLSFAWLGAARCGVAGIAGRWS